MTARRIPHPTRLDSAIARGDLEVVALRLALGVAVALEEWRAEAAATREDLIALVAGIGEGGLR